MAETVLITGGAGFIGSHTADLLVEHGYNVRILDCLDPQIHGPLPEVPSYLHPAVEFVKGDVRDRGALEGALTDVSLVLHLAAYTSVSRSMYEVSKYLDINVTGTAVLWEALSAGGKGVRRVVLASSRAVYGEGAFYCDHCTAAVFPRDRSPDLLARGEWRVFCPHCHLPVRPMPTREDKPLDPLSVYAHTKRFQEDLSRTMAEARGLDLVVLRYFNVYGPRQALSNPYTGIAPVFCNRLMAGQPIEIYEDGLPVRDFVHVRDVALANLLALSGDRPTSVTANVGSGEQLTVAGLARALGAALGVEPELQFTGNYRLGDIRSCYADLTTAREVLGFEPSVPLSQGISDLVSWVQEQNTVDNYGASRDELIQRGVLRQSQASGRSER